MKVASKKTSTRYDNDFSGNHIDRIRNGIGVPKAGLFFPYHKRFCETCQQPKPKDGTKAVKGWKCADCRKAGK